MGSDFSSNAPAVYHNPTVQIYMDPGEVHDIAHGYLLRYLGMIKDSWRKIADTWQGDAKTYYEGLQGEWNLAADGLFGQTGVMGQIASALNLSWNNYSEAKWMNLKTWLPGGR
ncbi:hypothetical protein GCM10027280_62270 [Micromonospora polyrhachis]|uniref:Uncharacterized protein YukE n=1 Tax=Micromonospora polyrhachis TaxID=1282883 RepID=A0A7W7SQ33_9ACTN|nr:hypothetical protein [Micromonospora polyrhachis]MBB4958873.1 uncharacterized protein YukE [Micromonospora polyrhachis]